MNFNDLTFEELDEHAVQRLVFDDEDISPILKGHIFIEKILEALISSELESPSVFFKKNRSFALKADLARAMGLIEDHHYSAFNVLNNIRNNYAHKHEYNVTIEELNGLKFNWEDIQVQAFKKACEKGIHDAALISTLFLCWKAIHLIKEPDA